MHVAIREVARLHFEALCSVKLDKRSRRIIFIVEFVINLQVVRYQVGISNTTQICYTFSN
jgi:hypothetical protein